MASGLLALVNNAQNSGGFLYYAICLIFLLHNQYVPHVVPGTRVANHPDRLVGFLFLCCSFFFF
jgi:hypothetical protein